MKPRVWNVIAKCNDMCNIVVLDTDGDRMLEYSGYVPRNIGIGGGEYIRLQIDIETGQILNWKRPSDDELEKLLDDEE